MHANCILQLKTISSLELEALNLEPEALNPMHADFYNANSFRLFWDLLANTMNTPISTPEAAMAAPTILGAVKLYPMANGSPAK